MPDPKFNYNWIVPGLAQGSFPDPPKLAWDNFDVLVLCAEEHQPRIAPPPNKFVFKLPLDDDPYNQLPIEAQQVILQTAHAVGTYLVAGCRVLSTCHQGLNRSGLITALLLMRCYQMPAPQAIQLIRAKRDRDALCNPMFEQFLLRVG
jgi:protein-tyrosine phosphatase